MTTTEIGVYVTAVTTDEVFADSTYQRTPPDVVRARHIAATWDRRLAGVLEVSDRGEDQQPRYAVVDGQHRWLAAGYLNPAPTLVANVHTGLSVADEAALFDKLNRQRRQITTWDHWRARRAAGDELVCEIETVVGRHGLQCSEGGKTGSGSVACVSTLEKIATAPHGLELLDATLNLLRQTWDLEREAYDAPLVYGMANVLHQFGPTKQLDRQRLINALAEVPPRRIRYQATALRDSTPGALHKLAAIVLLNQYNRKPGPRLAFPPRWTGSLPKAKAQ